MNENAFLSLPFVSIISIIKQFWKPLIGRSVRVLSGFNTTVGYNENTDHMQPGNNGFDNPQ
jgi:hypothetical protein